MTEFLKSIATAFFKRYDDLADFCFVFPSKRSGSFFQKYLKEVLPAGRVILSPNIITISDFIEKLSGLVVDNRIDLLFRLYAEYQRLQPDEPIEFDRFLPWGDTILSDFNDIDMYDVDAEALFKNLSDFKDIQSDYLTEDQKKVISEYFGNAKPWESANRFWRHFNNEYKGSTKSNFLKIWQVLTPLYKALNESLKKDGLCYSGGAYKAAYNNLKDNIAGLLPYKKVVFIGFNVLSTMEFKIFSLLNRYKYDCNGKNIKLADFYWDATGPVFSDKENNATRFVDKNREFFKSELDISSSDTTEFPSVIKSISAPSNSIQTKIITTVVKDIVECSKTDKALERAKIAIVLPDENLLLPLMHSMPENVKTVNLTMGYPLKLTSTASFISILKQMQKRKFTRKGEYRFFHEDVKALIAHPFMQLILDSRVIFNLKKRMNSERLFSVGKSDIEKFIVTYSDIFTPITKEATPDEVCDYLIASIVPVKDKLLQVKNNEGVLKSSIDVDNIETVINALVRLKDAIKSQQISGMSYNAVFKLCDKLLAGETVNFEGEPLAGLQVMGVLETRCLDFDYLIIPSMNERIFPQKIRQRTFIPNSLRNGYGMSTLQFQESIFAYHFYRMISRAKEVYLLHDDRTTGLRSGDISRYILQLKYIYPQANLKEESYVFNSTNTKKKEITIDKTNETVRKELELFFTPGSMRNISASSLKTYINCPLRFYLQYVKKMKVDEEPDEFMNAIMQGDIFHKIMENIYTPNDKEGNATSGYKFEKGRLITKEWIENLLDENNPLIINIIDRLIADVYLKTTDLSLVKQGDAVIFRRVLNLFTRNCLKADLSLAPFIYWGSEVQKYMQLPLEDGRKVNITFIIDRLDEINIEKEPVIRISDYKTGSDEINCNSIDKMFAEGKNFKAMFQLMAYATLYCHEAGFNHKGDVRLDIYKTRDLHVRDYKTSIEMGATGSPYFRQFEKEFKEKFYNLLMSIFDKKEPFCQAKEIKTCEYCPFRSLCQR